MNTEILGHRNRGNRKGRLWGGARGICNYLQQGSGVVRRGGVRLGERVEGDNEGKR